MDSTDFYIKRGDRSPSIAAVLKDRAGQPIDLTGKQVKFIMRSFLDGEIIINTSASPDADQVGNTGKVAYDWADGDTDVAGYHYAEWEVVLGAGVVQTFPTVGWHLIDIVQDLDNPSYTTAGFHAVQQLRKIVSEGSRDSYSDSLLHAMLVRNDDDIYYTAAEIWREKAAEYADLVDTSEGGSSRKLSQLYDRAVKQATYYETLTNSGVAVVADNSTVVRKIERI